MALKDGRGGREFDKFVADSSGNTGIRVITTAHETLSTSATVTVNDTTGNGDTIIDAYDITGKQRVGLQFVNAGAVTATFKVWGSLVASPGDPVANPANWCQIGDNVEVTASEDTKYKAMSTTPVKWIMVTGIVASSTASCTAYLMAD